jgi:hypothetical protein
VAAAWQGIGTGRLAQLVPPVVMAVVQSGLLPKHSTLGLGRRVLLAALVCPGN